MQSAGAPGGGRSPACGSFAGGRCPPRQAGPSRPAPCRLPPHGSPAPPPAAPASVPDGTLVRDGRDRVLGALRAPRTLGSTRSGHMAILQRTFQVAVQVCHWTPAGGALMMWIGLCVKSCRYGTR